MERGTGQSVDAGTAVSKESPQMHWKRRKYGRNTKKERKVYDEVYQRESLQNLNSKLEQFMTLIKKN